MSTFTLEVLFTGQEEDGAVVGEIILGSRKDKEFIIDNWIKRGWQLVGHKWNENRVFIVPWHSVINIEFSADPSAS
jgi:hypothetical protein